MSDGDRDVIVGTSSKAEQAIRRARQIAELAREQRREDGTDRAFYGLAGDFVHALEPHSEADPRALLLQLLVAFGNAVGHIPHWVAEETRHSLNLFCILIGNTADSRKGTSWDRVLHRMASVDPVWVESRKGSGLSSGEGLVAAVERTLGDEDKRLMLVESEFASTLRIMAREGNILSPTLRQAWDSGNLEVMNKNTPLRVRDAHFSLIGHITGEELLRYLTRTEYGNGFANRFLWQIVQPSKELPMGGNPDTELVKQLDGRLQTALSFGRSVGEMGLEPNAIDLWHDIYRELRKPALGLAGAVTSRAAPQTRRLACIYALLDKSPVVRLEHLEAAVTLWRMCRESAHRVFGDATGDPEADKALAALREAPSGLTRTEIANRVFGKNIGQTALDRIKDLLSRRCLIRVETEITPGRPRERWIAVPKDAART